MKKAIFILLAAGPCFGQQQQQGIQDLNSLVGKQVIAQRMPLCKPGTYTVSLAYAGKQAKVLSLRPFNFPRLPEANMSRLTPEVRATIEDQQKAATILVQFDDGTQLDSCGPVSPSRLSSYFELVSGETVPEAQGAVAAPATSVTPMSKPLAQPIVPPNPISSIVTPAKALMQSTDFLSDDEVKQAVGGIGRNHWVSIQDMGLGAANGNQWPSITLYLPEAVLAIQSESAKKQFIRYEPSEEEKRRSLMIVAEGWAGKTITEGCTSITRVVLLSDPSGGVVQEAYLSEPLSETWRNSFGATNNCQALRAKFSLADVEKVKGAARNGEFFVAVFAGSTNTKTYKIKKKFQSKLGWQ